MKSIFAAAASGFVLATLLAAAPALAQERVDANGMPTTRSTPEEQAQTAGLNNSIAANNQAADAQSDANNTQYQAQQQQYQSALQENRNAQSDYQDKAAHYQNQAAHYQDLRTRYAAERAAYHRGIWPDRYRSWVIVEREQALVGERVQIISGARVGTVVDTALTPGGRVEGLLVRLDTGKQVWIDNSDIRYNRADGIVMTNLDRGDLHRMADERL